MDFNNLLCNYWYSRQQGAQTNVKKEDIIENQEELIKFVEENMTLEEKNSILEDGKVSDDEFDRVMEALTLSGQMNKFYIQNNSAQPLQEKETDLEDKKDDNSNITSLEEKISTIVKELYENKTVIDKLDEDNDGQLSDSEKIKFETFLKNAYSGDISAEDLFSELCSFDFIKKIFNKDGSDLTKEEQTQLKEIFKNKYTVNSLTKENLTDGFLDILSGKITNNEINAVIKPETVEESHDDGGGGIGGSSGTSGSGGSSSSSSSTKSQTTTATIKDFSSMTEKQLETARKTEQTELDSWEQKLENTIENEQKSVTEKNGVVNKADKAYQDSLDKLKGVNEEVDAQVDAVKTADDAATEANNAYLTAEKDFSIAERNYFDAQKAHTLAEYAVENTKSALDSTPQTLEDGTANPAYAQAKQAYDLAIAEEKRTKAFEDVAKQEKENALLVVQVTFENYNEAMFALQEAEKTLEDLLGIKEQAQTDEKSEYTAYRQAKQALALARNNAVVAIQTAKTNVQTQENNVRNVELTYEKTINSNYKEEKETETKSDEKDDATIEKVHSADSIIPKDKRSDYGFKTGANYLNMNEEDVIVYIDSKIDKNIDRTSDEYKEKFKAELGKFETEATTLKGRDDSSKVQKGKLDNDLTTCIGNAYDKYKDIYGITLEKEEFVNQVKQEFGKTDSTYYGSTQAIAYAIYVVSMPKTEASEQTNAQAADTTSVDDKAESKESSGVMVLSDSSEEISLESYLESNLEGGKENSNYENILQEAKNAASNGKLSGEKIAEIIGKYDEAE